METYQVILAAEAAAIVVLGGILIWLLSKKSKTKKMNSLAKEKVRENELDNVLLNPAAVEDNVKAKNSTNIAYDVQYHEEELKHQKDMITVRIRVEAPLSTKKYMIQIKDKAGIGSGKGNEIEINDLGVKEMHCTLLHDNKRLFIKSGESGAVIGIRRKKKVYEVGQTIPRLEVGDRIVLGSTEIEIESIQ